MSAAAGSVLVFVGLAVLLVLGLNGQAGATGSVAKDAAGSTIPLVAAETYCPSDYGLFVADHDEGVYSLSLANSSPNFVDFEITYSASDGTIVASLGVSQIGDDTEDDAVPVGVQPGQVIAIQATDETTGARETLSGTVGCHSPLTTSGATFVGPLIAAELYCPADDPSIYPGDFFEDGEWSISLRNQTQHFEDVALSELDANNKVLEEFNTGANTAPNFDFGTTDADGLGANLASKGAVTIKLEVHFPDVYAGPTLETLTAPVACHTPLVDPLNPPVTSSPTPTPSPSPTSGAPTTSPAPSSAAPTSVVTTATTTAPSSAAASAAPPAAGGSASTGVTVIRAPKIVKNETVAYAKNSLRKLGVKVGDVIGPKGYPKAKKGYRYVVSGFFIETTTRVKVHGKWTTVKHFRAVKSGQLVPRGALVAVGVRLVKER